MASAVGELGAILRGGEAEQQQAVADDAGAAAAAAAAAGQAGVDISKLSQLSDFADKELQKDSTPVGIAAQFPQEHLIQAPTNPLAFPQQPSQPTIQPAPVLPDSQAMSQMAADGAASAAAAVAAAEEQQKAMAAAAAAAAAALPFDQTQLMAQTMALMPGMLGVDWSQMAGQWEGAVQHMPDQDSEPQPGPRSKSGKPTRRGPMDEMRQLVRILVKLLPQSIGHIGANEEAGGGNRISEEQIKNYLEKTLGDAPRPNWGVPNGWYSYVAELFSWAMGRPVDEESTKKCAKREPGRSWEALDSELANIGVHPHAWPLPLTSAGVRDAEKNPIAQPIPQLPAIKRGAGEGESAGRGRRGGPTVDLERLTEYELWKHAGDVLNACTNKSGTSPADVVQQVANLKANAKAQMDVLTGGGLNMLQYVPVMGLDGNPSMMAFLGGMQGMPMGLPPVAGQLMGPDGQIIGGDGGMAAANMALAAAAAQASVAGPGEEMGGEERSAKRQRREGEEPTSSTEDEGQDRDKSKAPMSSSEARGTLFGALGGGDATKEAAGVKNSVSVQQQQQMGQQMAQQQMNQLPLLYATQPGGAPFMMPPFIPGGFPSADGSVPAEGAPVTKAEGES